MKTIILALSLSLFTLSAQANYCFCDSQVVDLDPMFPGMQPATGTRSCLHLVTTNVNEQVIADRNTGSCIY